MKKMLLAVAVLAALTGCTQKAPAEYAASAQSLYMSGDEKSAVIEYKNALQQDAQFLPARLGLAEIYISQRKFDDAIKELGVVKDGLAHAPLASIDINYVNLLLARVYHMNGQGFLVKDDIPDDFKNPEISYYKFHDAGTSQDVDGAEVVFSKLGKEVLATTFGKLILAERALFVDKDVDAAKEILSEYVPVFDDAYGSWMLLKADVSFSMGETELALASLVKYVEANPNDLERRFQLANIQVRTGSPLDAKDDVTMLLKKVPSNAMLNELDSVIRYSEKDYEGSLAASQVAITQMPDSVTSRLMAAYSAAMLEKPSVASSNLNFIIDKLPKNHPAQRLFIKLEAEAGRSNEVSDRLMSLDDLSAADVALLSSVGLDAVKNGDLEKAKALADKAKELNVDNSQSAPLGMLQLSLNDQDGLVTLESAFEQSSDDWVAGSSLATAYLVSKKYDEAMGLADKFRSSGKAEEGNMLSGVVLARQSKYKEAMIYFNEVLAVSPKNKMAKAAIIESLVGNDQIDEAKYKVEKWVLEDDFPTYIRHYISAMRSKEKLTEAVDYSLSLIGSEGALTTSPEYNLIVGQSALLDGRYQTALTLLLPYQSDLESTPGYWLVVSTAQTQLGEKDAAFSSYEKWMSESPKDPMPLMGVLRYYSSSNDNAKALTVLANQEKNFDDKTPIDMLKIHFLMKDGKNGEAKQIFNSLPSNVKLSPSGLSLKADLSFVDGKFEDVLKALSGIYPASKSDDHLRKMFVSYKKLGKNAEAISLLEEHIKLVPESGFALYMLGNEKLAVSDFAAGILLYEAALPYASKNPMLHNNLAYAQWKTGNNTGAIANATKALEYLPLRAEIVDTLANALIDNQESGLAVKYMEEVISLQNQDVSDTFVVTYVKALVSDGKSDKALGIVQSRKWLSEDNLALAKQLIK